MIEAPWVVTTDAQLTAVIRLRVPKDEMRSVMGPAMGEVARALSNQGIEPRGPMFSHHFKLHPDIFDFEVGLPVSAKVEDVGRVEPSELPATKVARTVYIGPYESLGEGWREFTQWIESQGYTAREDIWETYMVGPMPGVSPSSYRTELTRPLV